MNARHCVSGVLLGLATLTILPSTADALVLARTTTRGYIVVDEEGADPAYEGRSPIDNTEGTIAFIAQLTNIINNTPGAPHSRYIAVMQTVNDRSTLAFYLGLRNDTRGIGQRSPIDNRSEIYDINSLAGTEYNVTGFVFLNSLVYYTNPALQDFGKYLICTQEFGHRFGTFVRNPPQPGTTPPPVDAGVDAATDDATVTDGDTDAAVDPDASAPDVIPLPDVVPPTPGPDLMATALLGRQTAHWSYFVHSGGSPMEGNNWNELMPGVFRSERPSFRFAPIDLYIMGLMPPEEVTPFYVIAEPDVMGQRDQNGSRITPASPTEYSGRTVTIRGRRVNVTIDDVIAANGPRIPAAVTPAGGIPDGGIRPGDLDVTWVLLTTRERLNNALVAQFDQAIGVCTDGYDEATEARSRLISQVTPTAVTYDAGVADAALEASAPQDAASDANDAGDGSTVSYRSAGGCGACSVSTRSSPVNNSLAALGAALALCAASRRRRH